MFRVVICQKTERIVLEIQEKVLASDLVRLSGFSFAMPCSGNHTCGKCKLKISGMVSPMCEEERSFLTEEECRQGVRLACLAEVCGDCVIELFQTANQQVAVDGTIAIKSLSPIVKRGYGAAFDIGTTTIAGYLFDLTSGELCCKLGELNRQTAYGADVLSRIQYAQEHDDNILPKTVREQISSMILELSKKAGISAAEISCAVVTGNTTMLHFFSGLDASGIAQYPFTPQSLFGCDWSADLLPALNSQARLYLPGCISSYVGADITCSILASGMMQSHTSILLDLGTNGEMALWKDGKCTVCSTAAGPAFEGAGLFQGMTAEEGAICEVWINETQDLCFRTVADGKARGICGSGIIDALAVFLSLNLIDETGKIVDDNKHCPWLTEREGEPALLIGKSGIVITQRDIRQVQLAKAAVAAGIQTLLHHTATKVSEVENLYLAGGFGNYIHPSSAAQIGLFPEKWTEMIHMIGNGAGAGASMLLLDEHSRKAQDMLLTSVAEIELSSDSFFMDAYIDQMMLEPNEEFLG